VKRARETGSFIAGIALYCLVKALTARDQLDRLPKRRPVVNLRTA
jgi:hypothetical protein